VFIIAFRSSENTQQVNGETARTAIQDSRNVPNETHAGGELRNSQQRESAARPMYCTCMNSGGTGRPPTWLMGTWAVNPRRCHVDGRANGQRVLTSRPPEETPTPSVLALPFTCRVTYLQLHLGSLKYEEMWSGRIFIKKAAVKVKEVLKNDRASIKFHSMHSFSTLCPSQSVAPSGLFPISDSIPARPRGTRVVRRRGGVEQGSTGDLLVTGGLHSNQRFSWI